jgi:hypothetical protein
VTREERTDKKMVVPVAKATADQTSLLSVEEHLVLGDSKVRQAISSSAEPRPERTNFDQRSFPWSEVVIEELNCHSA